MNFKLRHTANVVASGGIIAYPTEAVWGLGCDPDNPEAVMRLLRLKRRDWRKGLILVAASMAQFEPYLSLLNVAQRQQLALNWPGPVTWLVPHDGSVGIGICGEHATVALRVSTHPTVRDLCNLCEGPLVSTSANPDGLHPARDRLTARRYFGDAVDAYAPGALGGAAQPSEIRDLVSGKIIRAA
ncbi:MAG: L-threonylcarbamoyladenylate synthase [Pseudomonadales bacterium]